MEEVHGAVVLGTVVDDVDTEGELGEGVAQDLAGAHDIVGHLSSVTGGGELGRAHAEQLQIRRRIAAGRPAQHEAVDRGFAQVADVAFHEPEGGDEGHSRAFPGVVELHFGDRLETASASAVPLSERLFTRSDLRHRIVAEGHVDPADFQGHVVFAHAHDLDV